MEKNVQEKQVVNHFEAGSNCQVFNGNVTGCVFAMPGSTVTQQAPPPQQAHAQPACPQADYSDEQMASAIEKCQPYFWGNSAYAVVFCIYRDDLKRMIPKTSFESMIEELPYQRKRSYCCPAGTIANAFSDNPIFNESIDLWDQFKPLPRVLKLRDQLRSELKL
jgi:hypothetical protein